ncbi:MAG: haloacid dehalogenase [Dehalococcoidia bacterium]|nr:haloacid dehalogenase [Dehalococcoidia bacterium]
MKTLTGNLESIAEETRRYFAAKDAAREKALRLSREIIRLSSQAIRAVHRQDYDHAGRLLSSATEVLRDVSQSLKAHEDLLHSAIFHDAQKELAEGYTTLAMVTGRPLPEPGALEVTPAAYLNGLGEAVGEIRRYLLDGLRRGDMSRSEELLSAMDDIYSVLITMDFPEALTGGLRRTTDMVRGVLERTRGDLTMAASQKELEAKLQDFANSQKRPSA